MNTDKQGAGRIPSLFPRGKRVLVMRNFLIALATHARRGPFAAIKSIVFVLAVLAMVLCSGGPVNAASPVTMAPGLRVGATVSGIASQIPLALLLPDGLTMTDPGVVAWLEAAQEDGIHIDMVSDTQFLALGTGSNRYRGLILPDQIHTTASDALVAAVDGYVTRGGQAMLVYDFGALATNGAFAVPKSRFSALAGVDYLLYDELGDRTAGLGPITGHRSQLRKLSVPPGKSIAFTPPVAPLTAIQTRALEAAVIATPQVNTSNHKDVARQIGVLRQAKLASQEALYLPVSRANPGGVRNHLHAQQLTSNPFDKHRVVQTQTGPIAAKIKVAMSDDPADGLSLPRLQFANAIKLREVANTTHLNRPLTLQQMHLPTLAAAGGSNASLHASLNANLNALDPIEAISGYIYGALTYPSFVTRGMYAGEQLLSAPQFGLAAGINAHGAGKILFVNMPLTYLKASTDGMLLQGFLHYFSDNMLAMPRLASVPNGLGGLTLNWHLCSNFTASMDQLLHQGVFDHGPFSVHITAGPDTVTFGDGLGWDLPHNIHAQQMLRNLDHAKHQIGNHGGWIHDYFGENASETNQATFQPALALNKNAVDAVLGHASIEYAAPQGNNPTWSMAWQEQHGDVGTYFLGHTGMGPTRNYQSGGIANPSIWVMPVMPMGLYATFEEFIDYNVPKQAVRDWYREMVDFTVSNRTNRLIYMHPPGAADWSDVVLNLLNYAKLNHDAGKFAWYTIADMARFMNARSLVTWSESISTGGVRQFHASHPQTLATMTWLVPKATFAKPVITSGIGAVTDGGNNWLVKAGKVKMLHFTAMPL